MNQANDWLCAWCHTQGFGFCDLGNTFEILCVLTLYGVHLTRQDNSILSSKNLLCSKDLLPIRRFSVPEEGHTWLHLLGDPCWGRDTPKGTVANG